MKEKCNCHEWTELGTYLCPVHGHYNCHLTHTAEKMKKITCNICQHQFESNNESKDIWCPKCGKNESFSIR